MKPPHRCIHWGLAACVCVCVCHVAPCDDALLWQRLQSDIERAELPHFDLRQRHLSQLATTAFSFPVSVSIIHFQQHGRPRGRVCV